MRVHAMVLAVIATASCSAPPNQPRVDTPAAAPAAARPVPADPAVTRADALLEDLKRREAA
jgi:hypothetical protein